MIGEHIAEKLNSATGPTVICIPLRGWGACDLPAPNKDLGWAGPGPGPVWAADPDHPQWSLRAGSFIAALREKLDLNKPNMEVLLVDKHLNQPEFSDLMSELLEEMLDKTWTKDSHQNLPYIVPFE